MVILTHPIHQFNIAATPYAIIMQMPNSSDTGVLDVAVVGAGPIGNYIAYRLADLGHEVVVFEEHQRIGEPMQCTGIIGAECVERFPLFDGTILREVNSATLFSPSGRELRLKRDRVQAYIIDRSAFDRSLADKARQGGAQYLVGSRVKDAKFTAERAEIDIEDGSTYHARAVVIAGGFYSHIPRRIGLGRTGDFITGAQAEVRTDVNDGLSEVEIYFDQDIARGFFAWLVPTSPGRALAGLFSRRSPIKHLRNFMQRLSREGKIASPEAEITPGGIPLRPLRKTYRERTLVVGDAAGHVKPTTGGGIYYGLLCAEAAVNTLQQAIATDSFSEEALSSYQRSWRQMIGRELRIGYIARRLYQNRSNRQIDYLCRVIESNGIHESLLGSSDLSFDWHGKAIIRALQYIGPWRPIFIRGGRS